MTKTRARHPVFARLYPRMSAAMDDGGLAERRATLLTGLTGHVIDIGVGDGRNLAHYPREVTRVTAIEPEPHLRGLARAAAAHALVPVDVIDGYAEQLPAADGSCDAVVVSLVLCSVSDPAAVLREVTRVLRPGGQLRFLEHGRADSPGLAHLQRLLDAVWPHIAGGCHTSRDAVAAIEDAGLRIDRLDRFLFPTARTPFSFHTLGMASRPERKASTQ